VVNEYGKVLGLITLENLLEELFGEIRDEFDYEGPEITKVDAASGWSRARIEIDRLRESLGDGKSFGVSGPHTPSSVILRRLRRVPRPGENSAWRLRGCRRASARARSSS